MGGRHELEGCRRHGPAIHDVLFDRHPVGGPEQRARAVHAVTSSAARSGAGSRASFYRYPAWPNTDVPRRSSLFCFFRWVCRVIASSVSQSVTERGRPTRLARGALALLCSACSCPTPRVRRLHP